MDLHQRWTPMPMPMQTFCCLWTIGHDKYDQFKVIYERVLTTKQLGDREFNLFKYHVVCQWRIIQKSTGNLQYPATAGFQKIDKITGISALLKLLQNKKGQKNLGYPTKKQSFYIEKDCIFVGYPKWFWPFLFWSGFMTFLQLKEG